MILQNQKNNMKISGVYKITNTVTGDFYIGSSKNIKSRWANHKCPSALNKHPNIEAKKYLLKKESKTPIEIYDVYP